MKYVYSFHSDPYMIDDQQKKHYTKPWIRGICGACAGVISLFAVRAIGFDRISGSLVRILSDAAVYGLIWFIVVMALYGAVYLLGKAGVKVFSEEEDD